MSTVRPTTAGGQERSDRWIPHRTELGWSLVVVGVLVAICAPLLGIVETVAILALPVLAVAVVQAVRRPAVMLVVLVVVEVANVANVLVDRVPLPIFQVLLALGVLATALALRDRQARARLDRWTLVCAGLVAAYLLTQLLAALASQDVPVSLQSLQSSVGDCAFLLVVLMLAQITRRPWLLAAAVVVPLAVLCVLAVVNQVVFDGTASFGGFATVTDASGELVTTLRQGGPLPDSNFWGRHLVLGLPLAAALGTRAWSAGRRAVAAGWAATFVVILLGVYLTQSRGTLIATAVVLVVWVIAAGPVARRRGLVALPLVAPVLLLPGIGNRLVALVEDVSSSGQGYGVDPSVLGRTSAQEVAWAMFGDRPMFGVGPGVYPVLEDHYTGIVDTAVLEPTIAPHNLYAQLAAESGWVGVIGWIVLMAGFLAFALLAVARLSTAGSSSSDRSLAAAVFAGLVAWSVASIFLHLAYFRTLAVMLAFAGALGSVAVPEATRALRARSTLVAAWSGAAIVGLAVAGTVFAATGTTTHTARQYVTVIPNGEVDALYAYSLDVRSRTEFLPTYAAVLGADNPAADVAADPVRGVITVESTGLDEAAARKQLDAAVLVAYQRMSQFGTDLQYKLVLVGPVQVDTGRDHSVSGVVLVGSGGVVAGGLAGFGVLRTRRRTPDAAPMPVGAPA